MHSYIESFVNEMTTAGYKVSGVVEANDGNMIECQVNASRNSAQRFRVWVSLNQLSRSGQLISFGYATVLRDPRIGRDRLLDWTNLNNRATFDLNANGIRGELRGLFAFDKRATKEAR